MVFGNQDGDFLLFYFYRFGLAFCLPDAACRHIGEGEPEGRAFAGLGSQSDIASHVLYQHLADG